ncbi:MAG TPA: amidohydrolase family protein [Terriglobales bacterium]|jgi:imidazolonepropionase-like amidohydrolase|nr:amidohydrolase family protein [Terriglobales bacterium]
MGWIEISTRRNAGRVRRIAMLVFALLLGLSAFGQQSPKRTVILAGKLLDVRTGDTLSGQAIVIEGDRIVSVGPLSALKLSGNESRIELSNATLLPGMIDAHTHLTFDPQFGYESLAISVPREALIGAKNARVTLEAGFTTVRNVGADGYADVALRDAINAGDVPGPRMLVSGPPLGITGGHCDNNLLPFEYHATGDGVADGIEGVQHKVREVIKYGADLIKVCATGGVLSKGDDPNASQYSLEEMKAIVADAHRLGRKVAAHAHGAQGVIWASEAGVDSVEHGHLMNDEAIAVLKKNGTYLVPTLYLMDWQRAHAVQANLPAFLKAKMELVSGVGKQNVQKAIKTGVKIGMGTDAAVYPHGLNAHELEVYVQLGMTPLEAIQSATINDADLLGWKDKIGALEAGKWADIIAVDGDPLHDITVLQRVKFVMKGGQVVKNDYAK